MKLTFAVISDVYLAGHRSDDGMPFTAQVYFVQAEADDGRRWNHRSRFRGAAVEWCPETGENYFLDTRDTAIARAEHLLRRIEDAGKIDFTHWDATRPCYGSEAYCGAEELMLERVEGDGAGELWRVC